MAAQPPVIVLPGITATVLDDYYPLEPEEVWSAIRHKEFERIALHPDDLRYEALEPARVLPKGPFDLVYGDLVDALRHDLSKKKDKPTPVFGFGYDWRQDCTRTAAQLDSFIEEVLARTALLPHYKADKPKAVDLVGHSMGGLIIARYLKDKQDQKKPSKVRRVVTLGTPFRGSIHAIQKLAVGMGFLTGDSPRDRERETGRTIPALYQLLPSYAGAITADAGVPSTAIFDLKAWQPSLLATLKEYIRIQKADIDADTLLKGYLDAAKAFIDAVNGLRPDAVLPEKKDGWLPIVGIDHKTHVTAHIEMWKGSPWFKFPDEVNGGLRSQDTGDGTVPFLGACPDPAFLERERLVCVTKAELSFWEFRDKVLVELAGLHGFLPKINLVQKATIRFLRDDFQIDPLQVHKAPGVQKAKWPGFLKEKGTGQ